jgi:O-antigen ligase
MEQKKVIQYIDDFILFCFCVFVIFLPIAHTESIRSFSFGIPAALWIVKMILQRRWLIAKTPLDFSIFLFSIIGALSLINAVDVRYSAEEYFGEWLTGIFLFYLTANNLREAHLKYVLLALLIGNLLMVTYGIYDFFHQGGSLFDYHVRARGLHTGFYLFSVYLITTLPYFLIGFFFIKKAASRVGIIILLSLNFFALFLTYTRGAWVPAGLSLFLAGWKFLSKKWWIFSMGAAVILFFFFAPRTVIFHYTKSSFLPSSAVSIETSWARWQVIKFSLERLKENPFRMIGYGRRSFLKKYRDFYIKHKEEHLWHSHNLFLDIALQTGIQGLLIFVLLIYKLLKFAWRSAQVDPIPFRKFFFLSTFMMVLSFFVLNLFDDCFIDDSALLFWFLTGTVMVIHHERKKEISCRMN